MPNDNGIKVAPARARNAPGAGPINPHPWRTKTDDHQECSTHRAGPEVSGNCIDWDWVQSQNVKELAYGLRVNSELAMLAYKGLRAYEAEVGTPADDVYQLIEALVHNVSLGAFVRARKLEALPEAVA